MERIGGISYYLNKCSVIKPVETATDIVTDVVNDDRVVTDSSMLYTLPRFCLVHTVDSCVNKVSQL